MAFADYRPYFLTVKSADGADLGKVRALNDSDLSLLWQKHEDALELVFETAQRSRKPGDEFDAGAAVSAAVRTAPDLVTDVICLASGEDDWDATFAAVSKMPLGMRLEILGAVVRLTVESEGGLEKLFGLLSLTRPTEDR